MITLLTTYKGIICNTVMSHLQPVTYSEVVSIMKMKPSRAAGWDYVPPFVLKKVKTLSAYPLSNFLYLINQSFSSVIIPDLLKFINIIPIFKKGFSNKF